MKIVSVKAGEITDICRNRENYIFGASDTGKKLLHSLKEEGISIKGIWDNDTLKQGQQIEDVPVIPFSTLQKERDFNLFLGCAYAMQEENRIDSLINVTVYQIGKSREELKKQFSADVSKFPAFIEGCEWNKKIYADNLSREVSDAIVDYTTNYNGAATQKIVSLEEHYLIKEVLENWIQGGIVVDCGAYTGEFPTTLVKGGIPFQKCYCFEMEEGNCTTACQNMEKLGLAGRVEVVHSGIAEHNGYLYFESNGASSKLVDYETNEKVQVVSIDAYFQNKMEKIDFIKMDIEGAELGALKGGINIIKRDRPILAISVYHSFEDRVNIPRYLFEQLENYNFYLRQHSIWFSETVLYAIPKSE